MQRAPGLPRALLLEGCERPLFLGAEFPCKTSGALRVAGCGRISHPLQTSRNERPARMTRNHAFPRQFSVREQDTLIHLFDILPITVAFPMHDIRSRTRLFLYLITAALLFERSVRAMANLRAGDEAAFLSFPLSTIFPALLIVLLSRMSPAKSQEGILMRLGTIIQLIAIIALPGLALRLALGLPVVFLLVELYATRIPVSARSRISRIFVT